MIAAEREGPQYVLSYSYGKDSGAAIYVATEVLGWPLDRIVTADIWATDTIPADPPPMVEFKARADKIIKERWGIEVEHFCARDKNGEKLTYEKLFYHIPKRKPPKNAGGGVTAYSKGRSTDGPMCGSRGATDTSKCQPCNRPEIYGSTKKAERAFRRMGRLAQATTLSMTEFVAATFPLPSNPHDVDGAKAAMTI